MKAQCLMLALCLVALTMLAGAIKPKPFGPPVDRHWASFFAATMPNNPSYVVAVEACTNALAPDWQTIAWLPANGDARVGITVSNADWPQMYFRTRNWAGGVVNGRLYVH